MKNKLPSVEAVANSELIARTNLHVEQVIAKIHFDFALSIDSVIREALDEVNHVRRSKQNALGEPLKEHFSFVRYRIVQPPKISDMVMELHLMPIDFAYVALLRDPNTQDSAKTYVNEKVYN